MPDLNKQPYALSDGEQIALTDDEGTRAITDLRIGLGWDQTGGMDSGGTFGRFKARAKRKAGADLDLVGVLLQGKSAKRYAGGDSLDPWRGSVVHSGDNQTGAGDGDDEIITVNLPAVESPIDRLVFIGGALKSGTSFDQAANIEFNVYDGDERIATFLPDLVSSANAVTIAVVEKTDKGFWALTVINKPCSPTQGDFKSTLGIAQGVPVGV